MLRNDLVTRMELIHNAQNSAYYTDHVPRDIASIHIDLASIHVDLTDLRSLDSWIILIQFLYVYRH